MKTIEEEFPPEYEIDFEQDLTTHYTRLRARAVEMERALMPPSRIPIGTKVKHPQHGTGTVFSYDHCDETSCGVDFGKKGQWCIALKELSARP